MTQELRQPQLVIRMLARKGMAICPAPEPTLTMPVTIPLFLTNQRAVVLKAMTSMELRPMPKTIPKNRYNCQTVSSLDMSR